MEKTPTVTKEYLEARKALLMNDLTALYDSIKGKQKQSSFRMKTVFRQLNILQEAFPDLQKEILLHNSSSSADKENQVSVRDFSTFNELFNAIADICFECEESAVEKKETTTVVSRRQSTGPPMPTISLDIFDGTISKYTTFISLFDSMIHKNPILSDIEKFQYLIAFTSKEAKAIVSSYELVPGQYEAAYQAFTKRFSNKRRLAAHFVQQFLHYKSSGEITTFLDYHRTAFSSLMAIDIPDLANFIIFELIYSNCEQNVQQSFDEKADAEVIPTVKELFDHLEKLARASEYRQDHVIASTSKTTPYQASKPSSSYPAKPASPYPSKSNPQYQRKSSPYRSFVTQSDPNVVCGFCDGDHLIYGCPDFRSLTVLQRGDVIKNASLCNNCLNKHATASCYSKGTCRVCFARHHTLLHGASTSTSENARPGQLSITDVSDASGNASTGSSPPPPPAPATTTASTARGGQSQAPIALSCLQDSSSKLLGKIKCYIPDIFGQLHCAVALLDTGSEINIITSNLVNRLCLKVFGDPSLVQGVSSAATKSQGHVNLQLISSHDPKQTYEGSAVILHQICGKSPRSPLPAEILSPFQHLQLADPNANEPAEIDILLGAHAFGELISDSYPNVHKGSPTAVSTTFGWVLFSTTSNVENDSLSLFAEESSLEKTVSKFWEVESTTLDNPEQDFTPEDAYCEAQFQNTVSRNTQGRYQVMLPFKPGVNGQDLQNRPVAKRCALSLISRLRNNPTMYSDFHAFMNDYESEGHMIRTSKIANYLLPYHCVFKPDSSSTKTRVVFNASAQCKNGLSLNSLLYAGANLQKDISCVLTKFRLGSIAVMADVRQMFRQILLHPDHCMFQHILHRPENEDELIEFELRTLTYGFISSPFLAQRVFEQVAKDEGHRFPVAAAILREQCYMDDVSFSVNSEEEAVAVRDELINLLAAGCFPLRKWSSSHQSVIADLPESHQEPPLQLLNGDRIHKVLGLQWNASSDTFGFSFAPFEGAITKRSILSYTARLYDPNGYIAPIVFLAKNFIQKLWMTELDWDCPAPDNIQNEWRAFLQDMPAMMTISIPRSFFLQQSLLRLVGFSDGSLAGYSACVYLHMQQGDNCRSMLVKAKTRVAPLKKLTIPRLELLGAQLLAQVLKSLENPFSSQPIQGIHLFSDSQIVLAWLRRSPASLKMFVANRVQNVQSLTSHCSWSYVNTADNPSDLACRGVSASKLEHNSFWFEGPSFLQQSFEQWAPVLPPPEPAELPELKVPVLSSNQVQLVEPDKHFLPALIRFSSYFRAVRVFGWVYRFMYNYNYRNRDNKRRGPLSVYELEQGALLCVQISQADFQEDIARIEIGQLPSPKLRGLTPFMDKKNVPVLRVGGRVRQKNPVLLPKNAHLSSLICDAYHALLLHSGPRTTQSFIQRRFWILGLHSLVRKRIHNCQICHRLSAKPEQPAMAPLPPSRLETVRPFNKISIDFAGPIRMKETLLRKSREYKAYVIIIVCHSTRAVFCDLVSDMSSAAFLAAFTRFTSRRGCPQEIYTDNGKNFVGASRLLADWAKFFKENHETIYSSLASRNIKWTFATPLASNMSGLVEAGVKSMKLLLARQVRDKLLSWEEMATLLARVEAVLNSRPIGSLSSDPADDSDYLSPGHFLIGAPLLSPPEPFEGAPATLGQRWRLLQELTSAMWSRWKTEYVNTLVQQKKWFKGCANLQAGDLVYLSDIPSAPLSWPLGRIETVHPGPDGIVRSVTVRTASGFYKRPVNKLVKLPLLE